jgi:hypothetical protein
MNVKSFLTVKALVSLIFAAIQLLAPATLVSLVGQQATPTAIFLMRTMGASMLGIAILCWSTGGAPHSELKQSVLLELFVTDTLGFLVALMTQLARLMNAMGWGLVLIWLLLAAGLGYFRFVKPEAA